MEYRSLGNSGLKVSALGLGANTFGWTIDEQSSIAVINYALEQGINYIDTADIYDRGHSEEFVGKAIKNKRHEIVLASKFSRSMGEGPNFRGGSRYYILKAVEASLKRLQTDHLDLYQMHEPDPNTPIEETLRALDDLIKAGKVRYIGTSNFAAWQLCDAIWKSRSNNLHSFITEQPRYNILDRKIEEDLVPFCNAYNIGIIPWGPLAGGFLTGKYKNGQKPASGWRLATPIKIYGNMLTGENFAKLAKLETMASGSGHTVGELAIAWLLAKPYVSTVIAGAREIEQVSANLKAVSWKLTAKEVGEVDSISALTTGP
jgi:aryl-alcohol dehydrogenase-like predicted oxidoreductase